MRPYRSARRRERLLEIVDVLGKWSFYRYRCLARYYGGLSSNYSSRGREVSSLVCTSTVLHANNEWNMEHKHRGLTMTNILFNLFILQLPWRWWLYHV
jgi:hypothetical protein